MNQSVHIEQDVEERIQMAWNYRSTHGECYNQNFVVMCVVAPEGTNQKCESLAIKIFGCFPTKNDADAYAKKLSGECNTFDYFVANTQEWLKLPPQVASIDDVHYHETELSDIQQRLIDMRTARAKLMEEHIAADKAARKKKELEKLEEKKNEE